MGRAGRGNPPGLVGEGNKQHCRNLRGGRGDMMVKGKGKKEKWTSPASATAQTFLNLSFFNSCIFSSRTSVTFSTNFYATRRLERVVRNGIGQGDRNVVMERGREGVEGKG